MRKVLVLLATIAVMGAFGPAPEAAPDPVIAAAGDIACEPASAVGSNSCRQMATSDLLVGAGLAAVLPLGDNQYECGGHSSYLQSYDLSWGRVKNLSRPVPGNHEYQTSGGAGCDATGNAAGYFDYFGAAAGERSKGYYSYDIGAWHLIALNSNCSRVGGCGAGSPQETWLRNDLAAHPSTCTLGYWHHPRFSSGSSHGSDPRSGPLLTALYQAGAEVVLTAHDHLYERFAPQDPNGNLDPSYGIRQFVSGAGGKSRYGLGVLQPNSEVQNTTTFGVLKLTLRPTGYDWQFVPEAGKTFTDAGSGSCHAAPTGPPASDTTAPTPPTNLVADAASSTQVNLGWSAASDTVGVTGYEIYRDGAPLKTVGAVTTATDTTVTAGNTYSYTVRARDAAGNWSPFSNADGATTPAATGGTTHTFPAEADARVQEASPLVNAGTSYLRTDGGADPDVDSYLRFTVAGVSGPVTSAKLRVHAYTGSGNGPAVYSTSNSWAETAINWSNRPARTSAATDDKGAIAANSWVEYDVKSFVGGNGTFSFVLATSSNDGVDIRQREAASLQPQLLVSTGGAPPDTTPPTAPTNLSAVAASSTQVNLGWTASSDTTGVTGYEIYRGGVPLKTVGAVTNTTDTTVTAGNTYSYTIRARDAVPNWSAFSSAASATTPTAPDTTPPTAPTNLSAVAASSTQVNLGWTASSDTTGVTGYEIYRGGVPLKTVGAVTNTTDTTVTAGNTYSYTIRARDAVPNWSAFSSAASATTPAAGDSTLTFAAEADARVTEATPLANFAVSYLRTDGATDPDVDSYLRFTVTGVSGPVTSAKLRVHAYTGSANGPAVYSTGNSWLETGINWSNRPARTSAATDDKGAIAANSWVEYDVKSFVGGNGTYSFVLATSSNDGVDIRQREAASLQPQLVVTTAGGGGGGSSSTQPSFPIRAAFYYPWFPETWTVGGQYTHYHPTLGYYRSDDQAVIENHIRALEYGKVEASISSWWGHGHYTDTRLATILQVTNRLASSLRWAIYYEGESTGNPSAAMIAAELERLRTGLGADPAYLRVNGKFVVFVYPDGVDGCEMADRWRLANAQIGNAAYIVLKVFSGYRTCAAQPDSWHQYGPSTAADSQQGLAYTISPGFWLANETTPRLARDLTRWRQNVRDMVASNAPWQLVTTFNEWGEGTSVENATEWSSPSGFGDYLDALRNNG